MKKFILLVILYILLLPSMVLADTEALNLKDTIVASGETPSFEDYKESDDQVTLYLFRASGCNHCHDLVKFLDSIAEEYGSKFKLRSYECSENSDNNLLHNRVVNFFELKNSRGVPLLVIGENTFYGFTEKNKQQIIDCIEREYKKEDKYDVFEKMEEQKNAKKPNVAAYIVLPILAGIVIFIIIRIAKNE